MIGLQEECYFTMAIDVSITEWVLSPICTIIVPVDLIMASTSALGESSPTELLTHRLSSALRSKAEPPEAVFQQYAAMDATDLTDLIMRLLTRLGQEQASVGVSKSLLSSMKYKKSKAELCDWFDMERLRMFFRDNWTTMDVGLYHSFSDMLDVKLTQQE